MLRRSGLGPCWEAYSAPQTHSWICSHTSEGRGGRKQDKGAEGGPEGEVREGKGRGGKQKGREGQGGS